MLASDLNPLLFSRGASFARPLHRVAVFARLLHVGFLSAVLTRSFLESYAPEQNSSVLRHIGHSRVNTDAGPGLDR